MSSLLSLPFFILIACFAFLAPGLNFLYFIHDLKPQEKVVLGSTLGIVAWAVQAYIFGLMGMPFLAYIYIAVNIALFVFLYKPRTIRFHLRLDPLIVLIITVGVVLNLSAVWFIGVRESGGLYFCCRGVPDAIYHLSLTNELTQNFPPFEPGMSGVLVKNYHYLSNLVSANISKLFNLDFVKVQFQYMSLIVTVLLGSTAFVLANIIGLGKKFGAWLAIFLYASGDILYLLLLLRGKGLNFDVTIIDDATKLLAGPPRAFSILILFAGICLFCIWTRKKDLYTGTLMAILMGLLVGFKVYTGIFAISGLAFVGVYFIFKRRFKMLIPLLLALFISIAYYLPNNRDAGGLFFNGTWRFENFLQHKDLGISKLDYLRINNLASRNYFMVILLEIFSVLMYFTFLFGTVILGIFQTKKSLKLFPKELNIFLISAITISLFAGSFFYQSTGGANTIQFLISVFIVSAVYSSLAIYYWGSKFPRVVGGLILAIILILTTARAMHEGAQNFVNISNKTGFWIDNEQLAAFDYIKNNTPSNSKIIVEPWMAEDEPFMYVTFLTNRRLFLSGAGVLRDHGQDTKAREAVEKIVFTNDDDQTVEQALKNNKINYIYIPKTQHFKTSGRNYLKKVFENNGTVIFEVV
ncbi:hypothetical protein HY024_02700 [Candidatus Curtissbacteria bacterium]|nr:hypothetical protein [Candidatus Curtissbacteria bacterium]